MLAQVTVSGLAMGAIYALIALGYVSVWNTMAFQANGDCNHQVHIVEIHKGAPVVKSTVKF